MDTFKISRCIVYIYIYNPLILSSVGLEQFGHAFGKKMKRFFKPVEKDGSFKKPALSSPSSPAKGSENPAQNNAAAAAAAAVNEENNETTKEPSKFLTWNANSLLLRMKNNWIEFSKFVENFDPDVIAIQVNP